MDNLERIQLSSAFIAPKLASFFIMGISFLFAFGSSDNAVDGDFKTVLEYKLFFFLGIIGAAYFFTRPTVYADKVNLYIKRINKKEIAVPLKQIKSIFDNPFSVSKGTSWFTIEYRDDLNEENSIKFAANYSSDKITSFIKLVKEINPKVEIVR